ncbi:alpha/beta hydrolase [Streptomyces thermospinosisporus]|uniref:Alpha/beta hydrolase n=1 Tax=Streptomyces thermospinosisporus TaxID=161482 RepID=A0ABP4JGC2_9ACTN
MHVYGGMTQEELDREYSPSSCAPQFAAHLTRYATASDRARRILDHQSDVRYGPGPSELLDFYPPRRPRAPLFVFVHGGHWQEMSKEASAFAAVDLVEQGAGFIAVGYGLAPDHGIGSMVTSVRRALRWISSHAAELGSRPDLVFAGGSSAGAHLVATALCATAEEPCEVAGAVLLSGVYDLEPVRLSYVNDKVRMDGPAAVAHSPIHHLPLATSKAVVARGAAETAEYARQHADFVRALTRTGLRPVDLTVAGRDHFDLPFDLGCRGTALGDAVLTLMGL